MTTPAPQLYQLLSEDEILRIKGTGIRNCRYHDLTISEMMHLQHCLDTAPHLTLKDVLCELIKRVAKYDDKARQA